MYRSALEHVLLDRGFDQDRLIEKIKALDTKRSSEDAPRWMGSIDRPAIEFLKELADAAVHPNGGDIALQGHLDADLLQAVDSFFASLLEDIYEAPARSDASRARMNEALRAIKGRSVGQPPS